MGSNQSWGGIDIQGATAAITISGSGVLTLGTGGINVAAAGQDLTLSNNVVFAGATSNITVGTGRTVKLNGVKTFNAGTVTTLNGAGTVEIGGSSNSTGAGDVVLNSGTLFMNMQGGTHDRTGNTIINGGIVKSTTSLNFFGTGTVYFNGGAIGSGNGTRRTFNNSIVVGGDFAIGGSGLGTGAIQFSGNLDFTGGSRVITVNSTLELTGSAGNGTMVKQGTGSLVLKSGDFSTMGLHVAQGAVHLGGNGTNTNPNTTYIGSLSGAAGTTLSTQYNLASSTDSLRTLSVNQTVDGVFAGTITQGSTSRALSLVKEGSATLTLSGTNTYTGGTTINNGTLVAAAAAALGTGAVQANGGTLATSVANVNTGAFNLAGGTLVLNGAGAGTITLSPGQDFNFTAGIWQIDLASGLDQIIGSGAGSDFVISGGLIDLGGGAIDYTQTYDLIAGFENIDISGVGITGYDTANWQASINNNGELSFIAVPEPSTYGLLGAGALAAASMVRRRRRKAAAKAAE